MRMHNHRMFLGLIPAFALTGAAMAQDWPQWRGPERTGAVAGGARLIEAIPATGLPVLWRSEPIPDTGSAGGDGSDVGHSSPVAAGGRVYLYLNRRVKDDSPFRLPWGILNRLGCLETPLPEELAKKVEAARNSPQRTALNGDEAPAWASDWVARNLSHSQYVELAAGIEDRLIRGAAALDLRTLGKLAALKDRPYAECEDLEKALGETGLDYKRTEAVVEELTGHRMRALDVLFCFDAKTGKTLWKMEYPGAMFEYGTSSTPCIVGERIYISGGKTIYCLNLKDGAEIWQAPCPAKEVSSSPVVADGVLVIQAGALCALDASDGKLRWTRPEFKGTHASPTIWRKDGKAYAVQSIGLVDLQTGNLMWFAGVGGDPSPVVIGDVLVTAQQNGITTCYRLAADKPREIWKLTGFGVQPSTPILFQGHLYATKMQGGPLFCADLATGLVKWASPEKENYGTSAFNTASCILADGKVLLDGYPDQLTIVRANPERFELLGRGKVAPGNLRAATPTIADGRLFLRGKDALVCYDLRAK
jgi:outer membrane protein assembly factor BamB